MGLGDVKLAAVTGVWLDWINLPVAVNIAALSALASALFRRLRGVDVDPKAKLPFGAYFAPAIWICWVLAASRGDCCRRNPLLFLPGNRENGAAVPSFQSRDPLHINILYIQVDAVGEQYNRESFSLLRRRSS